MQIVGSLFIDVSSFKFKMSKEIEESVESDQRKLFTQLNNRDSTLSVEDIIAFSRGFEEKYAEKRVDQTTSIQWPRGSTGR